jgi:hypothetical protein
MSSQDVKEAKLWYNYSIQYVNRKAMKTLLQKLPLIMIMVAIALLSSLFGFSQQQDMAKPRALLPQKQLPPRTVLPPQKKQPSGNIMDARKILQRQPTTPPPQPPTETRTVLIPRRTPPTRRWIPPGQAKKMYGTKSARPFAPGQQGKGGKHGKGN